jgi:hypothetical protein
MYDSMYTHIAPFSVGAETVKKKLILSALLGVLLTATACGSSPSAHDSGAIAMVPFVDAEGGIRGVRPVEGWTDQGELVTGAIPGTREEAIDMVLTRIALDALPPCRGTYKGAALTWELCTLETQVEGAGPETWRLDLALAEDQSTAFFVVLIVRPDAYGHNPALYDTVFEHATYALAPLD